MYNCVERTKELCSRLQDDLSRKVFWARLKLDADPSMENAIELSALSSRLRPEQLERIRDWREKVKTAQKEGKKLYLYGTNISGQLLAEILQHEHIAFAGFCGRRAAQFPQGLLGKPVISPDWLLAHGEESVVMIAAEGQYKAIQQILEDHQFPQEHIISTWLSEYAELPADTDYFSMQELVPRGRAFFDGGCFDGEDSIRFAKCVDGDYSTIYAFEPDPKNCDLCNKRLNEHGVQRVKIVQAGLSNQNGKACFAAKGSVSSCIVTDSDIDQSNSSEIQEIETATIDRIVQQDDVSVGMIKMDIEGGEYAALQGGAETIRRDKPLLALSVYHKTGDVLAIMDYCATLVPEYKFWLRQCRCVGDTVLFAAVE